MSLCVSLGQLMDDNFTNLTTPSVFSALFHSEHLLIFDMHILHQYHGLLSIVFVIIGYNVLFGGDTFQWLSV